MSPRIGYAEEQKTSVLWSFGSIVTAASGIAVCFLFDYIRDNIRTISEFFLPTQRGKGHEYCTRASR